MLKKNRVEPLLSTLPPVLFHAMSDAGGGSTAYRLPVRDDEHSRLDRKRLWASLDPDRCGYLPARLLSDRLVQALLNVNRRMPYTRLWRYSAPAPSRAPSV